MTTFGLIPEGFLKKTIQDILSEIEDGEKAAFGPDTNTAPDSVIGQINSVIGDKLAEQWEVLEAVWASISPDYAQGASLDNVASITGVTRIPAGPSTVVLTVNLNPGTVLSAGRIVSLSSTGERFVTIADVSNLNPYPINANVNASSENSGDIEALAGTIDTIDTPVGGWTARVAVNSGASEPFALVNGQTLDISVDEEDPSQTITFLSGDFVDIGNATASEVADVIAANLTGGDAVAANGEVRVISDTDGPGSAIQITGGTGNTALQFSTDLFKGMNFVDATPGTDLESDTDFRKRRNELLQFAGTGTLDAVRADVLSVTGVTDVIALENVTSLVDANGLPAKSFEIICVGGLDQDIGDAIWASKPAGMESHRDPGPNGVTVTVQDSQGIDHDVNFSRPEEIQIYVEVDVTVDQDEFGDGDQLIGEQNVIAAIVAEGLNQDIGEDLIILRYRCAPLEVTGVIDVTSIKMDTVSPPVNTANIAATIRQKFDINSDDITVNVSFA